MVGGRGMIQINGMKEYSEMKNGQGYYALGVWRRGEGELQTHHIQLTVKRGPMSTSNPRSVKPVAMTL